MKPMEFKPMEFINNLTYMGQGMASILVVIGIIILITMALNKIPSKDE